MPGSWTTTTNAPPAPIATMLLLTDGSVLAQGVSTNKWYRYTVPANGDYQAGSWATVADSAHAPLYYASGVLRDGRVIVVGGEYDAGSPVWLLNAEIYDPGANTWTTLPNPPGWVRVGDAPGCVLPDGRFFVGQVAARNTAIYDPASNTWAAAADKINTVGEESWSLLPDGTIHAVDCSNPPNAEKYIIASDQWVAAGATLDGLVDSISEIGASVLLPDGRLFVIGATGFTALYTPPPIANQPGTWSRGPTIPQVNPGQPLGAVDAPAAVLPNGKVLFTVGPITSPASFQSPTFFLEYDPIANSISAVSGAATAGGVPYAGRMLVLPSGQVMYTAYSTSVGIYTPDLAPDPVWRPTITNCPASIRRGRSFTLSGRQINGLTQSSYYGNDATQATNYPIVRLESTTSSDVHYCRTFDFSTMGLNTGTIVHTCRVAVPSSVPLGSYCLRVIANGIASERCQHVTVTNKWFKELKYEIKEKLEILENLKEIRDLTLKRVPDIVDVKGIREDIDIFDKIDEEWTRVIGAIAATVDQTNAELSHAFIGREERPQVGTPEPEIEELAVPKISAAEAHVHQEKIAFAEGDDRVAQVSTEAAALHDVIHALSRSGGKVDHRDQKSVVDAARRLNQSKTPKTPAKAVKKAPAKKAGGASASKRTTKRQPPPQ
ncbi:MAG: kelch repeat-containing protein [Ilumatobacteraceae bacterium]